MKKRIVCVLLTLIMLMSLVPTSAFAAGMSISEAAITVLKQMEGYVTTCNATTGYTGYGTLCTEKAPHGSHKINEKLADKALRAELNVLDAAVNSFATKKGLNLTQSQHDALVLFSFENGTAWTTGTGSFQAAVASRKTGSEFLNAICRWDGQASDDYRRMVEANMYLYGVYSSSRPSNFICVTYDPNGGSINNNTTWQYYDVASTTAPHLVPTKEHHTFTGWYMATNEGTMPVTKLTASHNGVTLKANWVPTYSMPGLNYNEYVVTKSQLASQTVYKYNETKATFEKVAKVSAKDYYILEDALFIDSDYLDESGVRWCRIKGTTAVVTSSDGYWVRVNGTGSSQTNSGNDIDVTVSVTNSYVNIRANASIYSNNLGTYKLGKQLRIINTAEADGFLWGQVAESATDDTPVGWVALMYTNFESVRNSSSAVVNNSKVIATAVITYPGYVNVRSDAGTDNKIVGALPMGTEVSLYETKFVNGLEWGRYSTGWFCLSYASVKRLTNTNTSTNGVGFTSYVFDGVIDPNTVVIYDSPSTSANKIYSASEGIVGVRIAPESNVTVSNFVSADGYTWGKISNGWVRVTNNSTYQPVDVKLAVAKFHVSADSLAVRDVPSTEGNRVDLLTTNVEFDVNKTNQIIVVGETIWGYAQKVGESNPTYVGWVNLANKNVTRNGAPAQTNSATGLIATVTGTDSVNVRISGSTSAKQVGKLTMGTTAVVLEEKDGWYNLDVDVDGNPETGSWVYGGYLSIREDANAGTNGGNGSSNGTAAVETGTGIVANTYSGVNVRTGPSTAYGSKGKLLPGTAVEILEVTTTGTSKWGRVAEGWICMDYVTMISNYPIAGTTNNNGATNNGGNATTTTETAIYTGTTKQEVNIRKTTSLTADIVRTVPAGAPITMHEIVTVVEEVTTTTNNSNTGATTTTVEETSYWARVNDGYIYAPANHLNLDTLDEHTYTMTGSDTLNVRKTAGSKNKPADDVLFKLEKGDQVTITKLVIVNGNVWGFVECENDNGQLQSGWASLAYMTKGAVGIQQETVAPETTAPTTPAPNLGIGSSTGGFVTNTSGYRYTGKVINTDQVNVRTYASANNATSPVTTTLQRGASLVIYETTINEGMAWGRCDAGWIYLYYVDLTPVTGAVDARVVYNDNTVIYTDMNCSGTTGETYAKMSVIDIYEVVGKMARTDKGWVNTDNLLS